MPELTPLEKLADFVYAQSLSPSKALESRGWEAWYQAIFGDAFTSNLAAHHKEAIDWHWSSRRRQRQGLLAEFDAYLATWSREHRKSNIARALAVCDGALAATSGEGGYCLYTSGTKAKVRGHSVSIETLLSLPTVRHFYPSLSRVKRRDKQHGGFSLGWTAAFIYTEAKYIYHFVGLDEGVAGANVDDVRPSFIVPDDIDDREDSPVISENRFHVFTRAILPTRQKNTLVFVAQNLISRYSTTYQIAKQQARILTNRKPTEPIPAVRNLVTETRTVNGIVKDIIVAGEPSWEHWGLDRAQLTIDTVGMPSFNAEYQHEVDQSREGLVMQNWNDVVHVITKRDFALRFGDREIPRHWNKYTVNDWARTKTKYHANIKLSLAVSAQNSALPGCFFVFNARSFVAGAAPEDVAESVLSDISPTVKLNDGSLVTWRALISSVLQKSGLEQHRMNTLDLIEARRNVLANVIPKYVAPILRAQNYILFRGSHEQNKTGALAVYQRVFGLPFQPTNPGGDGGVDEINLAQRVDYDQPHPIKPDVMGYTRFFLVVEDEDEEYKESLTPDELTDSDLFRYQMRNWRVRDPYLTAKGEIEGEFLKMNDDYGNGLMMLYYDNCLQATVLSRQQKTEAAFPRLGQLAEQLRQNKTLASTDQMAYHVLNAQAKKLVGASGVKRWGEDGELIRD